MEILEVASFQTKPAAAQMGEMLNVVYLNANDSSSRLGAYKVHSNLIIAFNMACNCLPQLDFPVTHAHCRSERAFTSLSGSLLKFWHSSESMTGGLGNRGKKEKFSLQAEYSYWSELCSRRVNFQTSKEATVLIRMMLL